MLRGQGIISHQGPVERDREQRQPVNSDEFEVAETCVEDVKRAERVDHTAHAGRQPPAAFVTRQRIAGQRRERV